DHRGNVPDAYLECERIGLVHAAQFLHEVEHVPHGLLRQLPYAHEPAGAGIGETRHGTRLDSVKVTHGRPPFPPTMSRAEPVGAWSSARPAPSRRPSSQRSRRRPRSLDGDDPSQAVLVMITRSPSSYCPTGGSPGGGLKRPEGR